MKNKVVIPVVIVAIIALLIIIAKASGLLWPFKLVQDQLFNPIGTRLISVRVLVNEQWKLLTSIAKLDEQNSQLNSEVLELRNQLGSLKEVAHENELLRNQLNFNPRLNFELVPARVVSVQPDGLRKLITIDRGSSSGIKSGQAVVSSGVLVGTIDEVSDYSSKVFLVADPDFRIRAIGQDGRAQGIIRGQIGQGYSFDKVALSESITAGEQIITGGSGLVPQGILIGISETVSKADNAIFQSASVKPLINNNSLELVFVVTGLKK